MSGKHEYEHALSEIRRRLHDPRGRKATIMVGAGFSRNARSKGTPSNRLPDWNQLTSLLAERLYLDPDECKEILGKAGATSSAARLAQEFETAFRRVGLIEFVRDAIRDDEFTPGPLHTALLDLPWADVFTTNYDRLLEWAARMLWKQSYDIVTGVNDLPLARRPRIVKLHGSLPDLENLILTEDDYRTYGRKYAPFVTAVQAALTENVLCLIGFSGDDPNFLAWAGWLRDEMRSAVPNTYFFTGRELKPFQRQLLEERHIVPIALEQITDLEPFSFEEAYYQLFRDLAAPPGPASPSWNAGPKYAISRYDSSIAEEPMSPESADLVDTVIGWNLHRQRYKGWSVLYRDGCQRLWQSTEFWIRQFMLMKWSEVPSSAAVFMLHELVWRWSTSLRMLADDFVFKILDPQIARYREARASTSSLPLQVKGKTSQIDLRFSDLDASVVYLLQECLRHAREIGKDQRVRSIRDQLIEAELKLKTTLSKPAQAFLTYQEVLHQLGRLKHAEARRTLQSWDTNDTDQIWTVRRAGLCLEVGLLSLGIRLLENTLTQVRSRPLSPRLDIQRLSLEGQTIILLFHAYTARDMQALTRDAASKASSLENPNIAVQSKPVLPTESVRGYRLPSTQIDSVVDPNESTVPSADFGQLLNRLGELGQHGCDPNDWVTWLKESLSVPPTAIRGMIVKDQFDIGFESRTHSSGSEPQYQAACRAFRFLEDVGFPIRIPSTVSLNVAADLFNDALRTIAFFSVSEAFCQFLRSRDTSLISEILTRDCIIKLTDDQIASLLEIGLGALQDALSRLGLAPRAREAEDEFWDVQLRISCLVVGRIAPRLPDDQIVKVVETLLALPYTAQVKDRWNVHQFLFPAISSSLGCLTKEAISRLLPSLLALPVRGSSEFPKECDKLDKWEDPVRVVADFQWDADSQVVRDCSDLVDSLLKSIGSAIGEERINLTSRASFLLDATFLTAKQQKSLLDSLNKQVDEFGLPIGTGCFDSIILCLPHRRRSLESKPFFRKHVEAETDRHIWGELRRTRNPFRISRGPQRRDLNWRQTELAAILNRAGNRLDRFVSENASKPEPSPFSHFLYNREQKEAEFSDWLATLENVFFLNPRIDRAIRDRANDLLLRAEGAGWCTAETTASRVHCGYLASDEGIQAIRAALGERSPMSNRQACDAIGRWYELSETRGLKVVPDIGEMMATLMASRRYEHMSLLISTCGAIVERANVSVAGQFFESIDTSITILLAETEYSTGNNYFSMGKKLLIRRSCAEFINTARSSGIGAEIMAEWSKSLRADKFADIRREILS